MIEISKRCVPKNGKQETEDIVAWSNEIIKNEMVKPGQFFYGEENPVKIFQIGQKFGGNAIEVSK